MIARLRAYKEAVEGRMSTGLWVSLTGETRQLRLSDAVLDLPFRRAHRLGEQLGLPLPPAGVPRWHTGPATHPGRGSDGYPIIRCLGSPTKPATRAAAMAERLARRRGSRQSGDSPHRLLGAGVGLNGRQLG